MNIFDNSSYKLLAANEKTTAKKLPKNLRKEVKKASIKKLMKAGHLNRREAQNTYHKICKEIEITYGDKVLALRFDFEPTTGSIFLKTYS